MSGGEIAQIIVAVATLITSIGAVVLGWRNSVKIEAVHQSTNGLTKQLVGLTATSSKAEGNLAGRAELKTEQSNERKK